MITKEGLHELTTRPIHSLTFDELCELAEGLTDRNHHNDCRHIIAKWLKHESLAKIYNALDIINIADGHMHSLLLEYRREKEENLNCVIRAELPKEQAERLIRTM
jgi:hypothetical protein